MDTCTIHQLVTDDGYTEVIGSEVRMPDGTVIPKVYSVKTEAHANLKGRWITTITMEAIFGEPIKA